YCHEYVNTEAYPAHEARHTQLRPDGQSTDYATLPPDEREQGDLAGVPQTYVHRSCGGATGMPEESMSSYLREPYMYMKKKKFCWMCGEHVPFEECSWSETGENLQTYIDGLRKARGIMVKPTQEGNLGQCECCGKAIQTIQGTFRTPVYNGAYFLHGVAVGRDPPRGRGDWVLRPMVESRRG